MINIIDKKQCCGCAACVQRCPKQCITMREDEEGFLYPYVDSCRCINCGLCDKVCPIQKSPFPVEPIGIRAYAAINKDDDVRMESSSGGVFTAVASYVVQEGGVVFGVRFNDKWEAVFDYVDNIEELASFRGSKYIQAHVGTAFHDAERMLKEGRKVMFVGTSCQIKALKLFLRKDYPALLTVDFICHGVPSPGVWRYYLENILSREARKNTVSSSNNPFISGRNTLLVKGISFRDKCLGWKKFSFVLQTSQGDNRSEENSVSSSYIPKEIKFSQVFSDNPFMTVFLKNIILRPSCYACQAKGGNSQSDITIADFWGIENVLPDFHDDKGTSLIIVHTKRGEKTLGQLSNKLHLAEVIMEQAVKFNPSYYTSVKEHEKRSEFFAKYKSQKDFSKYVDRLFPQPTLWKKMWGRMKRKFRHILNSTS